MTLIDIIRETIRATPCFGPSSRLFNKHIKAVLSRILQIVIVLEIAVFIPVNAAPTGCHQKIKVFFEAPNRQTLKTVSDAEDQSCWPIVESSNVILGRLTRSVERGNRWSAQYLAEHLNRLDGGNLEDSLMSLGQFSDHGMEQLLRFKKEGRLSQHEIGDALTMLPLALSDNPAGQLHLLKIRRRRVMRINKADLAEEKAMALKAIDDFSSEIGRHL